MKKLPLVFIKRYIRIIVLSTFICFMLLTVLPSALRNVVAPVHAQAASQNPIQIENSKAGTPGWNDFSADLAPDTLSGFGSKISVNHSDSIDFYVTTTAPSFTINIYRTGYYGGAGARLISSLGSFPGLHQAIPAPDKVTGIISCSNWTKTTSLNIPSSWVTGVYLAKLTSSTGKSSFIFFVVRNDGGHENIDFQTSVTTYQAYNSWGGTSLYNNLTNLSIFKGPHATKVSFDRPFSPGDSNGAGHYFFYEYKFVYWLESQGYDLSYTTDVDTDTNVGPLTNHRAFLSVGHDEYWSKGMRDNVQAAINAGVNVAFFGANAMYWQIRFEPNAAGAASRVEVGYKDFATDTTPPGPDPMWGVNNAIVTTNWRADPVNRPENALIGVMFEDQTKNEQSYPFVVQNASNWVYAGTGFVNGSSVPGIVGYEYDKVFNNGLTPAGITILGNSPLAGVSAGNSVSNATLYTASSGARVFASGTIEWSWALANIQGNTFANAGIQTMTANILNNFIMGTGPTVALNPTSLNFGNNIVGAMSAAQTVTLSNSGSATLNFSNIAITGTNAADFAQTNTCLGGNNKLAAGSSCTINVTFTPGALGTRSASLTFTDSATDSPQSVALSGTGAIAAPLVSLSSTNVIFSNQNVGTSSPIQPVTLTNSGTTPLSISSIAITGTNATDFTQTNTCPSGSNTLAAGSSCTISVTFTPGTSGARSATLTFTDNAADSPQSVALSGTATVPTTYFSDGFESGNLNAWTLPSSDSTGARTVENTLVNSGSNALALNNASGQYAYVYTALPSGAQAQTFTRFYFRFGSNVTSGTQLAIARNNNGGNTWEIDYNANRHGLDFYVWSTTGGIYSIFSPTNSLSPNTWYGIELQDFQTTTGHAQAWLNGTSIGSVDADLSTSTPYARLMLYDSAPGAMYLDDVAVSNVYNGTIAPSAGANLNPTSVSFGNQNVGTTSAAQSVTLTDNGSLPLSISSIALAGTNATDFAQTNTCPTGSNTLASGSSCTISVTFTPGATGARSASLILTDNAAGSPQSVALSGTGFTPAPAVSLNPTTVSFGNQNVGSSSPAQAVTLTNSGTLPLSISSIALTGTNATDFAQTNTCPSGSNTLAAGSSCTVSVTFTPGASGARSATLMFTDNAADSPQAVTLSGTGVTATTYFSDGFESGNLNAWTLPNSDSTGAATVESTVVNSGLYSLALNNASGQYAYVYTALPSGPEAQTFTRFYFRIGSNVTGGTQLAIARNNNGGNTWEVDYNANRQGLDVYFWNGSGGTYSVFSPNNALSANTWYSITIQDYQTTAGHAQAWLNGTSIGSVDADLSTSTPFARLMFFDSAPGTICLDDVAVSNI
jgi:hypothetical protein